MEHVYLTLLPTMLELIMMFRILSESQLLETFRDFERSEVELPSLGTAPFPRLVRSSMSWLSPSGHRAYLVFAADAHSRPLGIVFRRDQGSSERTLGMCEWCHSVQEGGRVSLLTATATEKKRVGLLVCDDLGCLERARLNPQPHDMPRLKAPGVRTKEILQRMDIFARRYLF